MLKYLDEARRHGERIEYYHKQVGTKGYQQAEYHYEQLCALMSKAVRSGKYKSEVPLINSIRVRMLKLMDDMKDREIDS